MPIPRIRTAFALALGAAVLFPSLGACGPQPDGPLPGSGGAPVGGPVPAGAAAPSAAPSGQNLDEWLAYVEGEYITRRTIERQIGPKDPEEDESLYEERVHNRVLRMAMNRILVKAAQRATLDLRPDMVDKQLEEASKAEVAQAKKRAEAAKPGSGEGITFEKILKERGQSVAEYREELARGILVENYFYLLWHGVPGKRPVFDPEPAPEDAVRLYQKHREAFDVKPAVKPSRFLISPVDLIEDGKRSYDEAVAEARRRMASILAEHLQGVPAKTLAAKYGLTARNSWEAPEDWVSAGAPRGDRQLQDWQAWTLDVARRPGETQVFDGRNGDVVGVAIRDVLAARSKSFDEVRKDVLDLIRRIRRTKFELQTRLQLLGPASVHPTGIAEALEESIRTELKRIDEDPVLRDIKNR